MVAVPVSLIGTFSVMYLADYSLDILSLMALDGGHRIRRRRRGRGAGEHQAARRGGHGAVSGGAARRARSRLYRVVDESSLIAVFIPDPVHARAGRPLFPRILDHAVRGDPVSLVVSLTTTPMLAHALLRHDPERKPGKFFEYSERAFNRMLALYKRTLGWALGTAVADDVILLVTVCLNVYLYLMCRKGSSRPKIRVCWSAVCRLIRASRSRP